jgi:Integrase zinc binding domain
MDSEKKLHADILAHLASDPVAQKHLGNTSDPRWTQTDNGFLHHNSQIYSPEAESLQLRILQYKHDHVLLGHFGQNKTLALTCREYTWPGLRSLSSSFASLVQLVCGLNHSITTLWFSPAAPNPQTAMEFNIYGFH